MINLCLWLCIYFHLISKYIVILFVYLFQDTSKLNVLLVVYISKWSLKKMLLDAYLILSGL